MQARDPLAGSLGLSARRLQRLFPKEDSDTTFKLRERERQIEEQGAQEEQGRTDDSEEAHETDSG